MARIVVVDDNPDIGDFCRVVLGNRGHTVEHHLLAAEGVAAVLASPPDLVILDVMMEESDSGFVAARRIAVALPKLPILMLSTIAEASSRVFDTSELPVAALLDKPLPPGELVSTVERLLARRP
jgi:two-component system, OmpR family, response regulator MprA